ncbi:MAG: hypothetical protein GKS01_08945 [Alphaproteobacteria bacterium]|nr:hypothetical protein [Alphaproteobacteria bacterium]
MPEEQKPKRHNKNLRVKLISLGAVVSALIVPMVVYLAYDLIKTKMSPCGGIFEQTASSFESEIEFLKTKGKIVLGSNKIADLTERAQMTALNMETCCVVFGAGKRDPEKFLQCKSSAREYDGNLKQVVTVVKQAVRAEAKKASVALRKARRDLDIAVKATQVTSKRFNKQLVEARQNQAIAELKITPPAEVTIDAKEKEPNNDSLNTNAVALEKWVTGAIGHNRDTDFFVFVTPANHRDVIKIDVENRSTTLRPRLQLYGADKKYLNETYSGTHGANLSHYFVAAPKTKFLFKIANYDHGSRGAYLARVTPTKSYDAHEPNETILSAGTLELNSPVEAGLMDGRDVDYFKISTGLNAGTLSIKLENRSASLRPRLRLFDGNKVYLAERYSGTRGANIALMQKNVHGDRSYFVQVHNYDNATAGDYTLIVTIK